MPGDTFYILENNKYSLFYKEMIARALVIQTII